MNKKRLSLLFSLVLIGVTIYTMLPEKKTGQMVHFSGQTMGSITYNVKVIAEKTTGFQQGIDSLLEAFNESLSTYIPTSEISVFNQKNEVVPTENFRNVYLKSKEIHEATLGAFDPTVGPLINRWGFGPDKKVITPDEAVIDSLLQFVGFGNLSFQDGKLTKPANMYLDFSAIAKGQAVDEVGEWLEKKGVKNYMVEIGGEVRCRGLNDVDQPWSIGIEDPLVSVTEQKLLAIAKMSNLSVATSGNYRNYYVENGITYAHIVDPRTGYTAQHNLLSASVFAADCMTADAFATAFMVMGLEASIQLVENNPALDAVFVYRSENELDVYVTTGISAAIELIE